MSVTIGCDPRKRMVWCSCPFAANDLLRSLEGRHWNESRKRWEWEVYSQAAQAEVMARLQRLFPAALVKTETEGEIDNRPLSERIRGVEVDCPSRRAPYEHQIDVVRASRVAQFFILADPMGYGKTQAAIEAACAAMRAGEVERVLVLCPTQLRETWRREIAAVAWEGDPQDVAVVETDPPKPPGNKRRRGPRGAEYRRNVIARRATWTICHYPVVHLHAEELGNLVEGQFLIVDESQKLKNPRAKVSKAVQRWKPSRGIFMTGTPVENSPLDLWMPMHFCDPSVGSFWGFRDRYTVMREIRAPNGHKVQVVVGTRRLDELQERFARVGLRRTGVLHLPPIVERDLWVTLEGEQEKVYQEMKEKLRAELGDKDSEYFVVEAASVLSQMLRLSQIADGYLAEGSRVIWANPNSKLEALDDLVEEVMANGEKIVVWSRFVPVTRMVAQRYGTDHKTGWISGEVPQRERDRVIAEFCEGDVELLSVQLQTGAWGLNLQQSCHQEAFIDLWWNPAVNAQARARLHRIGQSESVICTRLLAAGTIDEFVLGKLTSKQAVADSLVGTGGEIRLTKQEVLDLLS